MRMGSHNAWRRLSTTSKQSPRAGSSTAPNHPSPPLPLGSPPPEPDDPHRQTRARASRLRRSPETISIENFLRSGSLDLSRIDARLQYRELPSRWTRGTLLSRRRWQSPGDCTPAGFLPTLCVFAGGTSGAATNLSGLFPRERRGRAAHLAKTGALSRGDSSGSQPRGGALISDQRQTRFGNLAVPSGAGSDTSVRRMATAVTCPMISASVP